MTVRYYTYRGTGEDTLTGGMSPQQVINAIIAREGEDYARPLTYLQVGEHGTTAGAARHRRRKENLCGPCNAAQNEYDSQRRAVRS